MISISFEICGGLGFSLVKTTFVPGYEGEGCSQCAEGCARSDSNVFICVRCVSWRVGIGVGQMQTSSFAQGQVERGTCV